MVTKQQLEKLFEIDLKPTLEQLDVQRKKIVVFYYIAIFFYANMGIGMFMVIYLYNDPEPLWVIPAIAGAVIGLIFSKIGSKKGEPYFASFKNEIIEKIFKVFDPEWIYRADKCIEKAEYEESKLFPQEYNRFQGDDLVSGIIEKTDFESCELHTSFYKKTDKGSTSIPVFSGYFFHADFNKNIKGETYVDSVLGIMTCNARKHVFRDYENEGLVHLENPELSRLFKVRSTDQIEARYILTPNIMEAIVTLYKQTKVPIHISFVGSRVYCAIDFHKELFEANIFKKNARLKVIENIYALFNLNAIIIRELNLNTRIWTKE